MECTGMLLIFTLRRNPQTSIKMSKLKKTEVLQIEVVLFATKIKIL